MTWIRRRALRAADSPWPRRRATLATTGLTALVVTAAAGTASAAPSDWAAINPVTPLTPQSFLAPPATDLPWVRMNMPRTADPVELQAEVQDLHDKGIAGFEVGQGAFPDDAQLTALLTKANELGIKVSLSHGPTQNPTGYSIDDDHARKTLVVGRATVDAGTTFDAALPAPSASANRTTLVAVLAYRCAGGGACATSGPVALDRSSVVDLTANVTGRDTAGVLGGTTTGALRWTAPGPAGAQWQLISFWTRGVFAQPDPFSSEGTEQLIDTMETELSPTVQRLLRANGGDIFFDSHSSDRGSPDELWTNRMAEEFRARKRYDLIPNLAALFQDSFSFSDGSAPRVRNDFYDQRLDIWLERHVEPLKAWARTWNQTIRIQPEGERNITIPIFDQVKAAAAIDRPEHESLFVGDEVDNYLPIASANHMTGNPWYSTECCAVRRRNYMQTFQDETIRMHKSYAGGITKLIYHVYSYRDGLDRPWPGYHNFGQTQFSNPWGPRQPFWSDARQYNDYYARVQQTLTQGDHKTDVAVYMQNYLYPEPWSIRGGFRIWRDTTLQENGYTRDYLSPALLDLPNATVSGGRLAVDGPAYKALIIDSEQEPATDPEKTSMPIDAAQKILRYAKNGLPVIIVGTPPNKTPGATPGADATLQALIGNLLAQDSVHQVAHQKDVPAKLKQLGIRPSAEPAKPSPLLSAHRYDAAAKTDYYYLYNETEVTPAGEPENILEPARGSPIDTTVTLEGRGVPLRLDATSGTIAPIADYTRDGDRVTVRVRLSRDNATLIALTEDPARFGVAVPAVHVTGTDAAASVAPDGDTVAVRATRAGSTRRRSPTARPCAARSARRRRRST